MFSIFTGIVLISFSISIKSFFSINFFSKAMLSAISENVATCAEYAFVVATAISAFASVVSTYFASLAIVLFLALTIARVSMLSFLAFLSAASVSAVSPDCDTTITSVFSS